MLGNGGGDFFSQDIRCFRRRSCNSSRDGLLGTSILSFSPNLNANLNGNVVYAYKTAGSTATTSLGIQYEARNLNDKPRDLARNLIGGLSQHQRRHRGSGRCNTGSRCKDMGFFGAGGVPDA